ncbi:MAG: glycosyltransferase family 2 protein [Dehalococcoidia bacterium]|nr:glycosyltransferase family 2 protein [Dehalococcoidia bacterium]
MYRDKKIGVVVPAYNEEPHIGKVLEGMPDFVDAVYVVDDASTDQTADIVRDWIGRPTVGDEAKSVPRVELIQHPVNRGVGAAIVTGYKRCLADGMDMAAVMAGDNQMEPQYLPTVLDLVVDGRADYSKGTRLTDAAHLKGMSSWRTVGNFTLRWLTVIAAGNRGITDPQNGYAAISREALEGLDLDAVFPFYGYCNDLLIRLSAQHRRIVEIPIPSMYHGEVSHIRYHTYIPKVSGLLARLFLLRITGRLRERLPTAQLAAPKSEEAKA